MKLDRIDIKILYELQKNGRITNVELAELVSLSPSPCLMRVKKLQAEGYIVRYSAQIDIAKLGRTLTVFTEVTLKNIVRSTSRVSLPPSIRLTRPSNAIAFPPVTTTS